MSEEDQGSTKKLNYLDVGETIGFDKAETYANLLDDRRKARKLVTGQELPEDLVGFETPIRINQKTGKNKN